MATKTPTPANTEEVPVHAVIEIGWASNVSEGLHTIGQHIPTEKDGVGGEYTFRGEYTFTIGGMQYTVTAQPVDSRDWRDHINDR